MDWMYNNVNDFDNCQEIAEEHLPCTIGFFLGSQLYDNNYYDNVKEPNK